MAPQEESKLVPPTPEPASAEPASAEPEPETVETVDKGKQKEDVGKQLTPAMMEQLLTANPGLASEFNGQPQQNIEDLIRRMKLEDMLTGMAAGGKNRKDMGSYKFWATQPVPRFDEDEEKPDGLIKVQTVADVSKDGAQLIEGFEWVTMDLNDESQISEVYELLTHHYVEDNEAMFRFNYSSSFFKWALKSPGWKAQWHVGVRVTTSRKLVAFISGIPVSLRVRDNTLNCSEINFLCIHKKLRSKRLTPVLIKEITRRCNLEGTWNAIYTAGIVLPKPVSTCRYYHRSLDWLKLHEVGFSPLPANSTKPRMITKYHLPNATKQPGLREMEHKDIKQVFSLLTRYLARFEIAPVFTKAEVEHWFLHKDGPGAERVVWAYVVEDPKTHKITDFVSFYSLESSVIGNKKHDLIRAAYLFYYATESAFTTEENPRKVLKTRLNELINDALILAKKFNFDVFNALTLLDNTLFLEQQKFGAGDGQLHYYLFNWRTKYIKGGIDERNHIDEKEGSGVGLVML